MNKTLFSFLGAVALSLPASATIIDDFTTGGPPVATIVSQANGVTSGPSNYAGTVTVGGSRTVSVTCYNGGLQCAPGRQSEFRTDTTNGLGSLSTDNQVDSVVTLLYNRNGAGLGVSFLGDAFIDFHLFVDASAVGSTVKTKITDSASNSYEASGTITTVGTSDFIQSLSPFTTNGVNLGNVKSILITIDTRTSPSDGADLDITVISSGVPEPSTMVLFGSALIGIGMLRRRR